ncbi:bromodomain-containing protein 8 [Sarcoptes scabiei]|nr:bromodomain-containing protein 8 [Sarcoptes scabiei]
MKKIQIAFQEIKSAIKQFEQLLIDCNRCRQKLLEFQRSDRTSAMIVKQNRYEIQMKQIQSDLQHLRTILSKQLPLFIAKRIDYFQPSLAAFICSGILHSSNNIDSLSRSKLDLNINQLSNRLDQQERLFHSLNNLSIVNS